jgi:TonB family protein
MLEEWDDKSSTNPFNNPNLLTTLEIRLNPDGTVDKVTVVKTSGYMPYDAAAIDVAFSAGPYPDPPREIRSKNGKIYLHWRFYRDARQCATSGVDPFILDNPPPDGDTVAAVSASERPAVPSPRSAAASAAASQGLNLGEGPRHLERNPGAGEGGGNVHVGAVATEEAPPAAEPAPPQPTNFPPRADNPEARLLAQTWFAAFGRGDVSAMLAPAVVPFRSSNGNAASKRGELQSMLRGLVDEGTADSRAVSAVQLVTAAGLRGLIGRLSPGLDDGTGGLYAVARAGNDTLILILTHKPEGWKVAGLARR